jgi:hypothetical protein
MMGGGQRETSHWPPQLAREDSPSVCEAPPETVLSPRHRPAVATGRSPCQSKRSKRLACPMAAVLYQPRTRRIGRLIPICQTPGSVRILLDTNVVLEDPLMRSKRFDVLREYARATESVIVLPQLVFDELSAAYSRRIRERAHALVREHHKLSGMLVAPPSAPAAIDIEAATAAFENNMMERLRVRKAEIVDYDSAHYREVLRRAMTRTPPCTDSGEEIRDAVLWLTVLDLGARTNDSVVFISKNTKQFAAGDGSLLPALRDEATARGVRLTYHPSLEAFTREHAEPIGLITEGWIAETLDADAIARAATPHLLKSIERSIERWSSRDEFELAGPLEIQGHDLSLVDFYVNQFSGGSLRLEVHWSGSVTVAAEVERDVEETTWDYEYGFDPTTGNYDYYPEYGTRTRRRVSTKEFERAVGVVTESVVVNRIADGFEVIDSWTE